MNSSVTATFDEDATVRGLGGENDPAANPNVRNKVPAWRRRKDAYNYVALIPFIAFALFPLYIMLITSVKPDQEISNPSEFSPFWSSGITLDQYQYLADNTAFFESWLPNTIIVAVVSTIISVSIGILAAYALARLKFRGVEAFGIAVFVTYLVPQPLLFIPLIDVINFIDDIVPIRDTYWSLIITYPTFLTPFVIWLLLGYFKTIPVEVEECAYLDGCSRLGALWKVVLPMAMPGIICAVLFAFTLSWNEFLYSLVFIQAQDAKTIGVGVFTELIRGDVYYWGSLMAACFGGTIPIVVLYAFFMDYYVSGLTSGAIK